MSRLFQIFFTIFVVFLSMPSKAGPIQQLNESHILSIQEYRIVTFRDDSGNLARTIAVIVRNETANPLYHVYLHLDSKPAHVMGDGSLYFPELQPGETKVSNNAIEITVDLSRQTVPELELIWQIETEIDGEKMIDEIAVSEVIQ